MVGSKPTGLDHRSQAPAGGIEGFCCGVQTLGDGANICVDGNHADFFDNGTETDPMQPFQATWHGVNS